MSKAYRNANAGRPITKSTVSVAFPGRKRVAGRYRGGSIRKSCRIAHSDPGCGLVLGSAKNPCKTFVNEA